MHRFNASFKWKNRSAVELKIQSEREKGIDMDNEQRKNDAKKELWTWHKPILNEN